MDHIKWRTSTATEQIGIISILKDDIKKEYGPKNKVRLRRKSALRVGLKKDIIGLQIHGSKTVTES